VLSKFENVEKLEKKMKGVITQLKTVIKGTGVDFE